MRFRMTQGVFVCDSTVYSRRPISASEVPLFLCLLHGRNREFAILGHDGTA